MCVSVSVYSGLGSEPSLDTHLLCSCTELFKLSGCPGVGVERAPHFTDSATEAQWYKVNRKRGWICTQVRALRSLCRLLRKSGLGLGGGWGPGESSKIEQGCRNAPPNPTCQEGQLDVDFQVTVVIGHRGAGRAKPNHITQPSRKSLWFPLGTPEDCPSPAPYPAGSPLGLLLSPCRWG